ncbi:probable tocopherol o-methyltransferase chloroplastic [Phtheirospermum japonicum]|uniref:Probable tocopherol o-methyltransferase chloroplastic n=1 Tax=Phtheirospermum japonicum TaxID=374723 RepID=A0A830C273_9LAMI|nr:probable tocopherol o-methyltransferase chloroplastic [Phtheirospermum japonicum]
MRAELAVVAEKVTDDSKHTPGNIVDVGCGVSFQVVDALNQLFPDWQFDLPWYMESGEHMQDKGKFVNELARVVAPGGTILIVTWCHRDLSPFEGSLNPDEEKLIIQNMRRLFSSGMDIKAADWSQYVAPFWPAIIKSALTWKGITSLLRSVRSKSSYELLHVLLLYKAMRVVDCRQLAFPDEMGLIGTAVPHLFTLRSV